MLSVLQRAFMFVNGFQANDSPSDLGAYQKGIYDGFSAVSPAAAVNSANAVNLPNVNPTQGGFVTNAEVKFMDPAFGANSVTLYQGFKAQDTTGRAQILTHEGLHLATGGSDQQLAAAAGVPGAWDMNGSKASAEFQKKLQEKCK